MIEESIETRFRHKRMSYVSAQKRILDVRVNVSWLHPDTKIIHTSKSAFVDEAKVKLSRERDSLV
jgi:hypothetical protein